MQWEHLFCSPDLHFRLIKGCLLQQKLCQVYLKKQKNTNVCQKSLILIAVTISPDALCCKKWYHQTYTSRTPSRQLGWAYSAAAFCFCAETTLCLNTLSESRVHEQNMFRRTENRLQEPWGGSARLTAGLCQYPVNNAVQWGWIMAEW